MFSSPPSGSPSTSKIPKCGSSSATKIVLLYQQGHIPGAVKLDWHTELQNPLVRDFLDKPHFEQLMRAQGHRQRYGGRVLWRQEQLVGLLRLLGVQAVRPRKMPAHEWRPQALGTGRQSLGARSRAELSATEYQAKDPDLSIRAFRDEVLKHQRAGKPLVDVRSPGEYTGELLHMPDYPQEGALRGGHIPGAVNIPWAKAANEDGTFKIAKELEQLYLKENGLTRRSRVVAYCRIGERSSHTWFVLHYLLGFPQVKNYDGSWTEWGNAVGLPIERGPGEKHGKPAEAAKPTDHPTPADAPKAPEQSPAPEHSHTAP